MKQYNNLDGKRGSPLVKWSLVLGIVIVMNLFFNYALSLVYVLPDYSAYVPQTTLPQNLSTKANCDTVGGHWDGSYCDTAYKQEQRFALVEKQYDRNIFIWLVILGVLSLIGGAIMENEVLSLAFSWAGVLSLFIASVRYWSDANNLLKVVILGVALAGLIYTAIKKFA